MVYSKSSKEITFILFTLLYSSKHNNKIIGMNSNLYIKINLLALLLVGINVNAQVNNYTFTQSVQTENQYYASNAATNAGLPPSYYSIYAYYKAVYPPNSTTNSLKVLYTGSDTGTTATTATGEGYPIGFNFIYHGESFDRVAVSENGYIKLGHSGQPITIKNDTLAGGIFDGSLDNQNVLASFQTGINFLTNGNAPVLLSVYGLPGKRVFTVSFSESNPGSYFAFQQQIELWEGSNIIGFAYPQSAFFYPYAPPPPLQGAIGMTDEKGDISNLSIVNGTNTWQTATQGSSPTNLCDLNVSLVPPGTGYTSESFMYIYTPLATTFSAPTCPYAYLYNVSISDYPNALFGGAIAYATDAYFLPLNNATNILTNSTLTWSDISVSSNQPTTYNVYLDIVNPPQIQVAQNLSATSFTPSTLAPNTKYYYEIVPKNASGQDSGCISNFTTDSMQQYCFVYYGSGRINSFTVNTLSFVASTANNQAKLPATPPYTTVLKRDTTYNCTITINSLYANTYPFSNTTSLAAWVDFNQNGDFNDPGEAVGSGSTGLNGTITFPVSIPNAAKLGATIMRLAWKGDFFESLTPCTNSYLLGEDEDFTVTITPATSCQSFTINPVTTNVNCFGQSNGSITLNPSGGAMPYTVAWIDGNTDITRTSLTKGIYQASITDANNCEVSIPLTPVLEPMAISTDTARDSNNAIHVLVSGGTGPYNYLWSNDSTSNNPNNFTSGTYSVKVTDAHGCDTTMQNIVVSNTTIIPPPPPPPVDSVTVTDSSININVYPNPNSGTIYLQSQKQQYLHIEIVSEQGKIMNDGYYTIGNGNATPVNIAAYPGGIYFLKIVGDKSTRVVKIIKVMK
jgi:hypothetical protein